LASGQLLRSLIQHQTADQRSRIQHADFKALIKFTKIFKGQKSFDLDHDWIALRRWEDVYDPG
jgi:hypothetical protein